MNIYIYIYTLASNLKCLVTKRGGVLKDSCYMCMFFQPASPNCTYATLGSHSVGATRPH